MTAPDVGLREVSPRLGLQAYDIPTPIKLELVSRLMAAGLRRFELSSFVRPDRVPGLADAAEVFEAFRHEPGASLDCCIGNERGLRAAAAAGADNASFLLSVDERFAVANIGSTLEQSLTQLGQLKAVADAEDIVLSTYMIFAWGGPDGPARTAEDLLPIGRRLLDLGVDRWILADSFGYAGPRQITDTAHAIADLVPMDSLTVQLHDSRGLGVTNLLALAEIGVGTIDTAVGGVGAHPAMPTARGGGVCTEDAVQALTLAGYETGIDLTVLIDAANWLAEEVGVPSLGFTRHTGPVPVAEDASVRTEIRWKE